MNHERNEKKTVWPLQESQYCTTVLSGLQHCGIPFVQHHDVAVLIRSRRKNASIAESDLAPQIPREAVDDIRTVQEHDTRNLSLDGRREFQFLHEEVLLHHNL
jgi:hypothetical protein